MTMALQMVLVVEGMYMSSLPPGQLVTSRADCVSTCYRNPGCLSVFYDTSTRLCVQVNAVYGEADMDTPAADMLYLIWNSTQKGCRDEYGYIHIGGIPLCYKVYGEDTWYNARDQCVQDGGHLISVNSSSVNFFMYQLCLSEEAELWTGGNDIDIEGTWVWADNSVFDYTSWGPGDPNDDSGQDSCMRLVCDGGIGEWRDLGCQGQFKFVCQTQSCG